MFGKRTTSRVDVAAAVVTALLAAFKAWDTTSKYKLDKQAKEAKENNS